MYILNKLHFIWFCTSFGIHGIDLPYGFLCSLFLINVFFIFNAFKFTIFFNINAFNACISFWFLSMLMLKFQGHSWCILCLHGCFDDVFDHSYLLFVTFHCFLILFFRVYFVNICLCLVIWWGNWNWCYSSNLSISFCHYRINSKPLL